MAKNLVSGPKNLFHEFYLYMLDIVASYHCMQFQGKITNQTLEKCKKPTTSFQIFWYFLLFYQIFLSPQVKWWAIITHKHDIYMLRHKLPNDLRLRILGN